MTIRFFDVNSDEIMGWGFRQKPLGGYFHFIGNHLHLNLNGGYPIFGFSEARLLKKVQNIVMDFRTQKQFNDEVISATFKARIAGEFYFYHLTFETNGTYKTERILAEDLIDQALPEKVGGGLRHGDYFVKPDGSTLWIFNLIYHIMMSLDAQTGKIKIFTRDPLMDSLLGFNPSFLIDDVQQFVMHPQKFEENSKVVFDPKQVEQMFDKISATVSEWLTPEHIASLTLEPTTLEVSSGEPIVMNLARLFSFQCVLNLKSTEKISIYTDKERFWLYSTLINEENGENLKTFEPILKSVIIGLVVEKLTHQIEHEINEKIPRSSGKADIIN